MSSTGAIFRSAVARGPPVSRVEMGLGASDLALKLLFGSLQLFPAAREGDARIADASVIVVGQGCLQGGQLSSGERTTTIIPPSSSQAQLATASISWHLPFFSQGSVLVEGVFSRYLPLLPLRGHKCNITHHCSTTLSKRDPPRHRLTIKLSAADAPDSS